MRDLRFVAAGSEQRCAECGRLNHWPPWPRTTHRESVAEPKSAHPREMAN
jgi:hypothetical protein